MGEYPLAWAACCNNESAYNLLLKHGADPNLQDSFGNMILHMVVVRDELAMYGYALRHPAMPAKDGILNKYGLTPLTLACKLGRNKIFREMFELSAVEFWRYSNITCSGYPLNALDSIHPNGKTNWNSALIIILNGTTNEHLDMLDGGVIQRLMEEKWKTYAQNHFLKRLSIVLIHLLTLSIAIFLRPPPEEPLLGGKDAKNICRYICEISTLLGCFGFVIYEQMMEIIAQGFMGFLINLTSSPPKIVFVTSSLMILTCVPFRIMEDRNTEDILLAIALPGSWFFLIFFAGAVKLTGPFVTMIYSMITGDMFRFSIIYLIFLLGFTQAFFFLFKNHKDYESQRFSSYPQTWMGLFQMTLGAYNYEEFRDTYYKLVTQFSFTVFMVFTPILLLNMLIAMMGNTYCEVIEQSEKEWMRQWAKIVVVLEKAIGHKLNKEYVQNYSIKLPSPPDKDDPDFEIRAVMVIKSKPKSKAKEKKGARGNWKRVGKRIVHELRKAGGSAEKVRRKYNLFRSANMTKPRTSVDANAQTAEAAGNLNSLMFVGDLDGGEQQDPGAEPKFDSIFSQVTFTSDVQLSTDFSAPGGGPPPPPAGGGSPAPSANNSTAASPSQPAQQQQPANNFQSSPAQQPNQNQPPTSATLQPGQKPAPTAPQVGQQPTPTSPAQQTAQPMQQMTPSSNLQPPQQVVISNGGTVLYSQQPQKQQQNDYNAQTYQAQQIPNCNPPSYPQVMGSSGQMYPTAQQVNGNIVPVQTNNQVLNPPMYNNQNYSQQPAYMPQQVPCGSAQSYPSQQMLNNNATYQNQEITRSNAYVMQQSPGTNVSSSYAGQQTFNPNIGQQYQGQQINSVGPTYNNQNLSGYSAQQGIGGTGYPPQQTMSSGYPNQQSPVFPNQHQLNPNNFGQTYLPQQGLNNNFGPNNLYQQSGNMSPCHSQSIGNSGAMSPYEQQQFVGGTFSPNGSVYQSQQMNGSLPPPQLNRGNIETTSLSQQVGSGNSVINSQSNHLVQHTPNHVLHASRTDNALSGSATDAMQNNECLSDDNQSPERDEISCTNLLRVGKKRKKRKKKKKLRSLLGRSKVAAAERDGTSSPECEAESPQDNSTSSNGKSKASSSISSSKKNGKHKKKMKALQQIEECTESEISDGLIEDNPEGGEDNDPVIRGPTARCTSARPRQRASIRQGENNMSFSGSGSDVEERKKKTVEGPPTNAVGTQSSMIAWNEPDITDKTCEC